MSQGPPQQALPESEPETWDSSGARPYQPQQLSLPSATAGAKVIGWPQPAASTGPAAAWGGSLAGSADQSAPPDALAQPTPKVFSVMDRQVHVQDVDSPPELYVMCRKWVQNDADNDVETIPSQPKQKELPPVKPKEEVASEPPTYEDNFDDYDPEEALRRLKEHWVSVRQWHMGAQKQQCGRFTERMKAMMPGAMLQVTPAAAPAARGAHPPTSMPQ